MNVGEINKKLKMVNLNKYLFRSLLNCFCRIKLFLLGKTENKDMVALITGCSKEPFWRASIPGLSRIPTQSYFDLQIAIPLPEETKA